MKRKADGSTTRPAKQRPKEPDYCDVEPRRNDNGDIEWPADATAIERARAFLREWYVTLPDRLLHDKPIDISWRSAAAQSKTLLVPDKDADGLSSGVIVYRTLVAMGLDPSLLDVHLIQKGSNIHQENERAAMKEKDTNYIVVLDQGSRAAPPVVDGSDTKSLIMDHHLSDEFPEGALVWRFLVSEIPCLLVCCRSSQPAIILPLRQLLSSHTKSANLFILALKKSALTCVQ
jgi:hypothetical protein